jgi:transposase
MSTMPKPISRSPGDSRRKYSLELKTRAIRYVLENGLPVAQVARDLDINQASLFAWVQEAKQVGGDSTSTETESEELRRLRAEVRELRLEREILKKATAFFAKESK